MTRYILVNLKLFFNNSLLAKNKLRLLIIITTRLNVKACGKSKFVIQSSLDLLTMKALVKPAKVINNEAIPSHNIIFMAREFFSFILFSGDSIYLNNLSINKTICIKVKYETLASINFLALISELLLNKFTA